MFSFKQNNILLFNLLATCFGHQTIIRPSTHKIYNPLHVVHIKFNAVWDTIQLTVVLTASVV